MMRYAFLFVLLSMPVFIKGPPQPSAPEVEVEVEEEIINVGRRAVCVVQSLNCNVTGTINMTQKCHTQPVIISGIIEVSSEYVNYAGEHGFNIHEFGVPNGNCTEAGGHYNPHGKDHGGPTDENRHVGDLGNVMVAKVNASFYTSSVQITDSQLSLYGNYSIAGRAIVFHQLEDDLGKGYGESSLVHGNAGARLACCTINMAIKEE